MKWYTVFSGIALLEDKAVFVNLSGIRQWTTISSGTTMAIGYS